MSSLIEYGYKKEIILTSPSTLMANLKMIELIWQKEYQNKNAKEIAKEAGLMYHKFVNFVEDLEKLGSSLKKANLSYEEAFKKLITGRGSLVDRANSLKDMGVDVKKELGVKSGSL